MGTCVGSIVLCGRLGTEDTEERFGRQLIQYQLSDILGDDLRYITFGVFDVPEDASMSEKEELIEAMLAPDARPTGERSEDVTRESYFILAKTLQLGVGHLGSA